MPPNATLERCVANMTAKIAGDDSRVLASGYSKDVRVYDMATASLVRTFADIHSEHINISRFTHHSPTIFATSSFDKTVKVWDTRLPGRRPIYTCEGEGGHVMLCFSPDDLYILCSGVDNEVRQHCAVDGRLHMRLPMPRTGRADNYTRAYYMGPHHGTVVSGSSEEKVVRLHCAHTGRLVHTADVYPRRRHPSRHA